MSGYDHSSWVGLLAPARVPQPVVSRLNAEAVKAAHAQDVKTVLLRDGLEATGTSPTAFAAQIKMEVAKWIKVAKAANIKAE